MKRHLEFEVHILNETGIEKAKKIRDIFDELLSQLNEIIYPENREFHIVRTKLEEACFFAKKSMAMNLYNQNIS